MTATLTTMTLAAWLAGVAAVLGATLAWLEGSAETPGKRALVHGVTAFGGGVLVAAVAYALTPPGMAQLGPVALGLSLGLGGAFFGRLDIWLKRRSGPHAQFIALVSDFVPEALAMGAVFSHDPHLGLLLAAFIGVQNLPEGFNAFRELAAARIPVRSVFARLLAVSLLGPMAALTGHVVLGSAPALTAAIMAFAAGGILYLVFQDIAPAAVMRHRWTPPLGAVLGFTVGMLGAQALG